MSTHTFDLNLYSAIHSDSSRWSRIALKKLEAITAGYDLLDKRSGDYQRTRAPAYLTESNVLKKSKLSRETFATDPTIQQAWSNLVSTQNNLRRDFFSFENTERGVEASLYLGKDDVDPYTLSGFLMDTLDCLQPGWRADRKKGDEGGETKTDTEAEAEAATEAEAEAGAEAEAEAEAEASKDAATEGGDKEEGEVSTDAADENEDTKPAEEKEEAEPALETESEERDHLKILSEKLFNSQIPTNEIEVSWVSNFQTLQNDWLRYSGPAFARLRSWRSASMDVSKSYEVWNEARVELDKAERAVMAATAEEGTEGVAETDAAEVEGQGDGGDAVEASEVGSEGDKDDDKPQ